MPLGSLYSGSFAPIDRDAAKVRGQMAWACVLAIGLAVLLFRGGWMRGHFTSAPLEIAIPALIAIQAMLFVYWALRVRELLVLRCAAKLHEHWMAIPRAPRPLIAAYLRRQLEALILVAALAPFAGFVLAAFCHVWSSFASGWSVDGAFDRFERAARASDWPVLLGAAAYIGQFFAIPALVTAVVPLRRKELLLALNFSTAAAKAVEADGDELETWELASRGSVRGVRVLAFEVFARRGVAMLAFAAGCLMLGFGASLLVSATTRSFFPRLPGWLPAVLTVGGAALLALESRYTRWAGQAAERMERGAE